MAFSLWPARRAAAPARPALPGAGAAPPGSARWFDSEVLTPGLVWLAGLGGPPVADEARRWLLAVAMQESGLTHRAQVVSAGGAGPARGWWQFEQGGGAAGVLRHAGTAKLAAECCRQAVVAAEPAAVWRALEGHDRLATAFARLLLWTDPDALPTTADAGWRVYLRQWRPGKPRPEKWAGCWVRAGEVV
jgi:hypothetical protein